jgi:hypothetical protein
MTRGLIPEDREGLMRDLVHAPVKKSVLIPNATHFVLFEKHEMRSSTRSRAS